MQIMQITRTSSDPNHSATPQKLTPHWSSG
uniref:Uncharacterized protein n=1 Tax=Arundo donax TaxID=35708 RepID=A0A0A9EEC4_ARUDO